MTAEPFVDKHNVLTHAGDIVLCLNNRNLKLHLKWDFSWKSNRGEHSRHCPVCPVIHICGLTLSRDLITLLKGKSTNVVRKINFEENYFKFSSYIDALATVGEVVIAIILENYSVLGRYVVLFEECPTFRRNVAPWLLLIFYFSYSSSFEIREIGASRTPGCLRTTIWYSPEFRALCDSPPWTPQTRYSEFWTNINCTELSCVQWHSRMLTPRYYKPLCPVRVRVKLRWLRLR
jgi:hypothetical protein